MITLREILRCPEKYAGQICIGGWVRTARSGKNVCFIELNDGTSFASAQIVYDPALPFTYEAGLETEPVRTGCAVRVEGELVLTPNAQQAFEIHANALHMLGNCPVDYPMQKKRHSLEYLRTQQTLRPRTNTFAAVFRVRSVVCDAIHNFFQRRGFVYVHTPLLTNADCEGRGEMFQVTTLPLDNIPKTANGAVDFSEDFFKKAALLSGTGQMYGEVFALAFRDIYTFGPTFRSEYSFTARHAAEFWMIEPEMAFCDLEEDMDIAEAMIKHIVRETMERCPLEMEFFNKFIDNGLLERLQNVVDSEFDRITYTEAVALLLQAKVEFQFPVSWGMDLQSEHERYLTETVYRKPIFVTDYPKEIKPFYARENDDGKTVAAVDLLVPGVGEIIGGSQREERLDVLERRIGEMGLDRDAYWWYLDLRRFGGTRHAGFGLGFERLLMYLTGVSNIRDVIPFPRTSGSAEF